MLTYYEYAPRVKGPAALLSAPFSTSPVALGVSYAESHVNDNMEIFQLFNGPFPGYAQARYELSVALTELERLVEKPLSAQNH